MGPSQQGDFIAISLFSFAILKKINSTDYIWDINLCEAQAFSRDQSRNNIQESPSCQNSCIEKKKQLLFKYLLRIKNVLLCKI